MDVKIEKKKGFKGIKPRYWAYIGAGVLLLWIVVWLSTSDMSSTYKVDSTGLQIADVQQELFDDYVRVDGRVMPIRTVQISPEEGGIVREIVKEEGSKVKKGDVIIRLSNSNLDLQILNAEAELAEKQNILRNTQISMEQDRLNNRTEQAQQVEMDHGSCRQHLSFQHFIFSFGKYSGAFTIHVFLQIVQYHVDVHDGRVAFSPNAAEGGKYSFVAVIPVD